MRYYVTQPTPHITVSNKPIDTILAKKFQQFSFVDIDGRIGKSNDEGGKR